MKLNRAMGITLVGLSLVALGAVLSGYTGPLPQDEGPAAHIFQISIVLLVPAALAFLATLDWKRAVRSAWPLLVSAGVVAVAFVALYHLEHRG